MTEEYFTSRPLEIETAIKETWSDGFYIDNFFSLEEIEELKRIEEIEYPIRDQYDQAAYDITSPRLDLKYDLLEDLVKRRLPTLLEFDFEVERCWILRMSRNFPIHTDMANSPEEKVYKQCLLTYKYAPEDKVSKLILFKQRTLGRKTWFAKGSECRSEWGDTGCYNLINSYDFLVDFNNDISFDVEIYKEHLGHMKYENLDGLTVDQIIENKLNRMIIFDGCQIHSSSDWNKDAVTGKSHLLFQLFRK